MLACGSTTVPDDPPTSAELPGRYQAAGERLYAERSSSVTWADGSNWGDGISHELPELPIGLLTPIHEAMTCAQWEALESAVFPEGEGYDRSNWQEQGEANDISGRWRRHLAVTLFGESDSAVGRLQANDFVQVCGSRME